MSRQSQLGRLKHAAALLAAAAVAAGGIVPAAAQELEEIIVTARKIEESLQEAPVAVSVVSGDTLARMGSQDLTAVGQYAPNVIFETGQSTSFTPATPPHARTRLRRHRARPASAPTTTPATPTRPTRFSSTTTAIRSSQTRSWTCGARISTCPWTSAGGN